MLFSVVLIFSLALPITLGQQIVLYFQRGETAELCDNRSTTIFAYEYRSLDGSRNSIVEPSQHERYSNPYGTSLLRINSVNENDSGLYKCPQDDTEWQKLQVYGKLSRERLIDLKLFRLEVTSSIDNVSALFSLSAFFVVLGYIETKMSC